MVSLPTPSSSLFLRGAMTRAQEKESEECNMSTTPSSIDLHSRTERGAVTRAQEKESEECNMSTTPSSIDLHSRTERGAVTRAQEKESEECNMSTTPSSIDLHSRTESTGSTQKPVSSSASRGEKQKQVSVSDDQTKSSASPKKIKISKILRKQKQAEVSVNLMASAMVIPCIGNNLANVKISTKLTLGDETWPTDVKIPYKQSSYADMRHALLVGKIGQMRNYRPEEVEHERRTGVSTELKLFSYPWNITKRLTKSDLNHLSRLLVKTCQVEEHVLPFLDAALVSNINSEEGWAVAVQDHDTNSMHNLVFKRWITSKSYVFIGNWKPAFVQRRGLSEGDEIGMYWDRLYSRFSFCFLARAPRNSAIGATNDQRTGPSGCSHGQLFSNKN